MFISVNSSFHISVLSRYSLCHNFILFRPVLFPRFSIIYLTYLHLLSYSVLIYRFYKHRLPKCNFSKIITAFVLRSFFRYYLRGFAYQKSTRIKTFYEHETVYSLFLVFEAVADVPTVKTPHSTIYGHIKESYNGKEFSAFEGIPYAKPPSAIWDLR